MKKILTIALSFMLILGGSIPTYAKETKNIDELLAPYKEVVDKVNAELGSTIYIPEGNKEKVYNKVKDMSIDEVETMLKNDYKAYIDGKSSDTESRSGNYTRDYAMQNGQGESTITPRYIREDITQTAPISQNSEMFLDSTVFSATGAIGTYTYESINSYGSQWPSDYTGYHFEVDSGYHSLSSDSKKCTVTLKGHPENAAGFAQLVVLTETVTFSPN